MRRYNLMAKLWFDKKIYLSGKSELINSMMERLTDFEKKVFDSLLRGKQRTEIAQKLDCNINKLAIVIERLNEVYDEIEEVA